jgi:hypothetical protein
MMPINKLVKMNSTDAYAFSRKDLCCSATLNQVGVNRWEAFGCDKRAMYKRIDGEWQRIRQVQPGAGSPSNKLPDYTQ